MADSWRLGRHDGQSISINAPADLGDDERGPTGFSATELLLAGAGACAAWDVVEILRKRRAQVAALEVTVDAEQGREAPWTYRSVTLHFHVICDGLTVPVHGARDPAEHRSLLLGDHDHRRRRADRGHCRAGRRRRHVHRADNRSSSLPARLLGFPDGHSSRSTDEDERRALRRTDVGGQSRPPS